MEPVVVGPKSRRGRKRKRNNEESVMVNCNGVSNGVKTRSLRLVNRYVQKEFQGSGFFLGKIILYNSGLYRVNYEDGDFEDLDGSEIKALLVEDGDLTGKWFERKKKLDELLLSKDVNAKILKVDNTQEPENASLVDSSLLSGMSSGDAGVNEVVKVDYDGNSDVVADCSSDSCEDTQEGDADLDMEVSLVPPPELPPSSGHIGVPEEYVSHLLSVYSFLRSFSVPLFLYPFELDDFVGALNCSVANTLLDSVHVALLRVLKRHLERLSSGGSELASKCLRCLDWSLLDTLTWPIYLVHYLMLMGDRNGQHWKGFYIHSLERDYYSLSAGKKLVVMQILCEGVLDSEELRIELDQREESEVGVDIDTNTMAPTTCKPRRAHPGYSKTSSCKDIEAIHGVAEINSALGSHSVESAVGGPAGSSIDEDGNGDECRLCGMDGLLVCCDGCPSSYHSRCLGLNKMFMPDGSWYCPECKINATEPKALRGTALRGGDVFGVDPYGQVFVASFDHLLVLKASINSESCLRYYSRHDIPAVLHALYSKQDYVIAYSEICRGIMQYWEIPQDLLPCNEMSKVGLQSAHKEGIGEFGTPLVKLIDEVPDMSASCLTNYVQLPVLSEKSLDTVTRSDWHMDSRRQQSGFIMTTTRTEPASFSSLIGQPADPCQISQQSTSSVTKTVSHVSGSINSKYTSPLNGTCLEPKASIPCQELNNEADRKGSRSDFCFYMGSSFKPTGYINYYLHGDFAASAAAQLAILSPEENQVVSRSLVNHRKVLCASVALQVKAFSSSGMRFFWPNTEKKLVEVPRERCGWCFSCKTPVSSKKGCLLNAAASNAIRGSMKVLAGLRPVKNGDGRLHGIATYILFMEESLSGLLSGPFLNDTFRKQWCKKVEHATSCNAIKICLRELEENIRIIALSGDWTKIVEGSSTQSSISQIAASVAGSTQKRRPGRRGKKPSSALVEVAVDGCQDMPTDFTWWRGGRLSKLMFRRGILPCSIIRKSARQGGSKEILGIHYVEGNDTPKSSKQLAWRSAVEMSRNTAQLALQVRYLDFYVRWSDLVRPEQSNCDGKGPEAEAHAFRNGFICDKKTVGHEIRYSVAFGSQKHLPSRVMKNITEVEQILGDGKERYWFSETYIPLYLIKEYEQKVEQNMPVDVLSELRRGQSKASRRNIFSDLLWKQDNMVRSCCSCHQNVFYRNVVKCSECQGFCHEHCATSSSAINMSKEVEFLITCKQCVAQATAQVQSSNGSPTSPLPLQGRDFPNPPTVTKCAKSVLGYQGSSTALREHSSEVKSANRSAVTKKSNKKSHWGLIWRKNNCEDTGIDFRLKNILLRGNPNADLIKPICRLCSQPHNADLMYILCETCQHWFHADAVELDESRIFLLLGFKCCKCRRSRSPICPYMDPEKKKALEDRMERKQAAAKLEIPSTDELVGQAYSALITTAQVVIHDKSRVDYGENNNNHNHNNNNNNATVSGPGPMKLPVRRHVNQEKDVSTDKLPVKRHIKRETNLDYSATDPFRVDPSEANDGTTPQAQWVDSRDNFDDGIINLDYDCLDCDDVEYEPQTYFSFNELLASDDDGDANGNVIEKWERENGMLKISYDQEDPIISVETDIQIVVVPCKICSNLEPCPDLCCQICGVWIHNRCSPWFESSSWEDGWRCGDCREWR